MFLNFESISRVQSETLTPLWYRETSGSVLPLALVSLVWLLVWLLGRRRK